MNIFIKKAGVQTIIQDLGRFGSGHIGVQTSGPMDVFSFKLANLLVGNKLNESLLEIAMSGPILCFRSPAVVAITGARFQIRIDHKIIFSHRPILVLAGSELVFGTREAGCRAYLAIAGGITVSNVLGSKSTNLQEGFGGYSGRALKSGDELSIPIGHLKKYVRSYRSNSKSLINPRWYIRDFLLDRAKIVPIVRFIPTKFWENLPDGQRENFLKGPYKVTAESSRMGFRLRGEKIIGASGSELSKPTTFGTIQLPPDGSPIILMADCQTVGGYPVLGVVITFDHSILGQLSAGDCLEFEVTNIEVAQRLLLFQSRYLIALQQNLKDKDIRYEKY